MKYQLIKKTHKLVSIKKILYSPKSSMLFLKNEDNIIYIHMPSLYFYKVCAYSYLSFIFLKRHYFVSFLKHLLNFYKGFVSFFFIKIKMRGLGYRIRCISKNIFSFFFNYTNFFYFFVPRNLLVKSYKKRMILVSNDWCLLKLVLSHILLLKRLGPYNLRGLRLVKQIVFLKKSGKVV